MLKRIYALLMALVLSLSLTACSEEVANVIVDEVAGAVIEEMVDVLTEEKPASEQTPEISEEAMPEDTSSVDDEVSAIAEDGIYTSAEDVALYIHTYGYLPQNFMTKKEARSLGWESGSLEPYAPGMCIGGDRFGNYEGLLPEADGRKYTECDIDTLGAEKRGAKRIVFSNDGLIYYTEDHYEHFTLLYGEE